MTTSSKKFPFDVAIAGALGAVIALTLALTLGWPPYVWPFLGLVLGPICYRPREIGNIAYALSRDLADACQRQRNHQRLLVATGHVAAYIGCVLVAFVSSIAISLSVLSVVWCMGILPLEEKITWEMIAGGALWIASVTICFGWLCEILALEAIPQLSPHWVFPLTRRILLPLFGKEGFQTKPVTETNKVLMWNKIMFQCLFVPPFLQLCTLLTAPLAIDLGITGVLACASTRRIAAMFGATLGCSIAAVCALCGAPWASELLLIGGVTGWYAGALLFLLREYLATSPSMATVE